MADVKKIVLAYSGGLDTSIILKWLQETYKADVVAFVADVGQGDETEPARQKALDTGACAVHVGDLREEFVRDFVFPAMQANAIYEGSYLLGTSVARPLIAKAQIDVLREEKADAVSHGATGKGNDQVRFELTYYALEPNVTIIAPWRDPKWDMPGRSDMIVLRRKTRHPRARDAKETLFHGPESTPSVLRGRHSRGSLGRTARGHVRADDGSTQCPGRAEVRRGRV